MNAGEDETPTALTCPQCGGGLNPGETEHIVCPYCATSLIFGQRSQPGQKSEVVTMRGMRLKPFVYIDREGTGLELFRMLAPPDWELRGGCRWLLDNPGMPATVAFQIYNPNGAEMFEVLPNMNFTWHNNPMTRLMTPVGSRHFGAEVRSPMGIQQAMQEMVLPRYRGMVQNFQIKHFEVVPELPKLAKSEAPLCGGSAEGGKIRITYNWQSSRYEEEIYGVVEVFRAPIAGMFGAGEILIWFIDFLFLFRAAEDQLDATANLFSAMIRSFQLNPQWYAAYKSIIQSLAQRQIQRIHHIGQIGQLLAQTGREIREQNLRDWYDRQAVYDRLSTDWSRTIRDVDGFFDPHRQEVVELPTGYGHAWANNLGEYILTEDSDFNPNLYSNLHWEAMETT